jgi:hypothetical protein
MCTTTAHGCGKVLYSVASRQGKDGDSGMELPSGMDRFRSRTCNTEVDGQAEAVASMHARECISLLCCHSCSLEVAAKLGLEAASLKLIHAMTV